MIKEIIDREWYFFQNVHNLGGRAYCQDDYETFQKQRTAQFMTYPPELLKSYLQDLKDYETMQRNPMMEKYGYMMKTGDPEYFASIEEKLPAIDEDKLNIINSICAIQVEMKEEFNRQYPTLGALSRLIHTDEDQKDDTSFETYLRCELLTYFPHSLYLYGKMMVDMVNNKRNMIYEIMTYTVQAYGYQSVEEAEEKLK